MNEYRDLIKQIPGVRSGVYTILWDNECLKVGKSTHLRKRLMDYCQPNAREIQSLVIWRSWEDGPKISEIEKEVTLKLSEHLEKIENKKEWFMFPRGTEYVNNGDGDVASSNLSEYMTHTTGREFLYPTEWWTLND